MSLPRRSAKREGECYEPELDEPEDPDVDEPPDELDALVLVEDDVVELSVVDDVPEEDSGFPPSLEDFAPSPEDFFA